MKLGSVRNIASRVKSGDIIVSSYDLSEMIISLCDHLDNKHSSIYKICQSEGDYNPIEDLYMDEVCRKIMDILSEI